MFCPSCRGEFREGYTHCDECGADLVETLSPDEPSPEDLVPVLETSDGLLVSATRSALESAEIPFVVQGEEAQGLFPVDAVILVPREWFDEAREVIAGLEQAPAEEPE